MEEKVFILDGIEVLRQKGYFGYWNGVFHKGGDFLERGSKKGT